MDRPSEEDPVVLGKEGAVLAEPRGGARVPGSWGKGGGGGEVEGGAMAMGLRVLDGSDGLGDRVWRR